MGLALIKPMAKPNPGAKKHLTAEQREALLKVLGARFEKNAGRHKGIQWSRVQARLEANPEKLGALNEMERTGGEPDVVGHDKKTGEYIFYDCSAETPQGRRNGCYDREGQNKREKEGLHPPGGNAMDAAAAMGIEILSEKEYEELQRLGKFDAKTSSWVKTPPEVRKLGGAIFADFRYGRVFFYHNGAQSFYSSRGFRGSLRV